MRPVIRGWVKTSEDADSAESEHREFFQDLQRNGEFATHTIQKRALAEGLPYQTLISSPLHKYASGRLKDV
jgi:hypothetical protein